MHILLPRSCAVLLLATLGSPARATALAHGALAGMSIEQLSNVVITSVSRQEARLSKAAYYELDLQWLWKPRPNVDVALIGQNLLHREHREFGAGPGASVYRRTALLKLAYRL